MIEEKNKTWKIVIDDAEHEVSDPVLTGRQVLGLAGKRPAEEHLVYFWGSDNLLEDVSLEETIDLRKDGKERFLTFKSDRSFRFELDGQRQDWGAPKISETTLRKLAGIGADYGVWMERRGQEDKPLGRGEMVDLSAEGVERFYTGRDDTTAGSAATSEVLPSADRRYFLEHEIPFEEVTEGNRRGVIYKGYLLPVGRFEVDRVDILVLLPAGYPDAAPDMFYCDPWLRFREGGTCPPSADQPFQFQGRRWQRWSRHNTSWRAGVDGFPTMLRRIDRALRGEA
jgi:hypothetical protein